MDHMLIYVGCCGKCMHIDVAVAQLLSRDCKERTTYASDDHFHTILLVEWKWSLT